MLKDKDKKGKKKNKDKKDKKKDKKDKKKDKDEDEEEDDEDEVFFSLIDWFSNFSSISALSWFIKKNSRCKIH